MAVEDVTRGNLLAIIDGAKAEGKLRTCNVLLADLKQMFRFAESREVIRSNPLARVSKRDAGGADVERDRFLSEDELTNLATLLPKSGLPSRSCLMIWLLLATAVRVSELTEARWSHVDFNAGTWSLPATKSQRAHVVSLSTFASGIFHDLRSVSGSEEFVLLGRNHQSSMSSKTLTKQIADRQRPPSPRLTGRTRRTNSLTLPGGAWTPHDLRRTAATLMGELGVSPDIIDECLNHSLGKITRIYMRSTRQTQQKDAFQMLGDRLSKIRDRAKVA
jgi:integrase